MANNTQICATIPGDLALMVKEISTEKDITFSKAVSILLRQAVKERQRKKNAKEVRS